MAVALPNRAAPAFADIVHVTVAFPFPNDGLNPVTIVALLVVIVQSQSAVMVMSTVVALEPTGPYDEGDTDTDGVSEWSYPLKLYSEFIDP